MFRALRAKEPVTVDGKFDEPCWSEAAWYTEFVRFDLPAPKQSKPQPTRSALCFDDQNVYWAAEMTEPRTADLVAQHRHRDAFVWTDDSIELFLDSRGDRTEYYHFVVNSQGFLYDDAVRQSVSGVTYDWKWNTTGQVAAMVNDGKSWTVEMSIPLAELEVPHEPGKRWTANVVRNRRVGGGERSTAMPLMGTVHDPQRFGSLEMVGGNFGRFAWAADLEGDPQIVALEDGFRVDVGVAVRFLDHNPPAVGARAVLRGGEGGTEPDEATAEVDLDDDRSCTVTFSFVTKRRGDSSLTVELVERDVVLVRRLFGVRVEYAPIKLRLLEPWYKASYFYSQRTPQVVTEVKLGVPEEVRNAGALVVEILRGGKALKTVKTERPGVSQEVRLETEELPVGRYEVRGRFIDGEGHERYAASTQFTRRDQVEGEIWVDAQRATLVSGNRFLPFGWFFVPQEALTQVADDGCNTIVAFHLASLDESHRRAYLDQAFRAGLKVLMQPYHDPEMYSSEKWREPLTPDEEAGMRGFVRRYKSHPALLGWYLADEPEVSPASEERLQRIYNVVSEEDPYHPCVMVNGTPQGMWIYGEFCDVLMPDPYPLFVEGSGPARPLTYVGRLVDAAKSVRGPAKPIWVAPQAFSYRDMGWSGHRPPNLDELRSMMWLGVAHNAKGFLWYAFFSADNYPEIRLGIPFLAREAQALKDGILASSCPVDVTVPQGKGRVVSCLKKGYDGHYYVVAVNPESSPVSDVAFHVEALRDARLWVASENRFVQAKQGRFKDDFQPYEAHVYSTQPRTPLTPTVAEVRAEIGKAKRQLAVPGNLAYEGHGATAQASSALHPAYAQHVLDGYRGPSGIYWRDTTADDYPDWLAVTLPEAKQVSRVVLYGTTAYDFDVEVKRGEKWVLPTPVRGNYERCVEVRIPPTVTDGVRIVIHKARGSYSEITELELYEK